MPCPPSMSAASTATTTGILRQPTCLLWQFKLLFALTTIAVLPRRATSARDCELFSACESLSLLQTKAEAQPSLAHEQRQVGPHKSRNPLPHVLFVLVDDVGFGDVGFNLKDGDDAEREILTPNINGLVREGIQLTRHYVASSCAPSRTAVQSGRFPVHTGTVGNPPLVAAEAGMPKHMTGIAEKLVEAGYKTHMVGKWDVGMSSPKHLPRGRGYSTFLGYFSKDNDMWTQQTHRFDSCGKFGNFTDFWLDDGETAGPASKLNGTDFMEFIFMRHMEKLIDKHDPADPLFLFYAPHVAHTPLQVPEEYLNKFDFMTDDLASVECMTDAANEAGLFQLGGGARSLNCRQHYRASMNLLDDLVGTLVAKLRAKDMWDNMLLVFSSDNGGSLAHGASNYPLKGEKMTLWEGGIRAAAFVSGGFVPQLRRGTSLNGITHIVDWYATFCSIANVDVTDLKASKNGLPPIDGVDLWPYLSGASEDSPRTEVIVDQGTLNHALIQNNWKLIRGYTGSAVWSGLKHPNSSYSWSDINIHKVCEPGCLYDVAEDPGEREDLAEKHPDLVQQLGKRLEHLGSSFLASGPDTGGYVCNPWDLRDGTPCACWMAENHYGGFFGPFVGVEL